MSAKTYKFPRRFSRSHCMSKTCDKMGFTEKASCRPYKNCYPRKMVGGKKSKTLKNKGVTARSRSRSSRSRSSRTSRSSRSSGNVNPAKADAHNPEFAYHSEHTTFTSHPETGTPYGKRTVVNVQNGKAMKTLMTLNANGSVIKTQKCQLDMNELASVKEGKYVPGMWSCFTHKV